MSGLAIDRHLLRLTDAPTARDGDYLVRRSADIADIDASAWDAILGQDDL